MVIGFKWERKRKRVRLSSMRFYSGAISYNQRQRKRTLIFSCIDFLGSICISNGLQLLGMLASFDGIDPLERVGLKKRSKL
ncbi:hypothetical protein LINGRAHAP2_LOCUS25435 [Linum grandiflorum]